MNALSTTDRSGSWHWDREVLPLDFEMLNFSDMEEDTRKLYKMTGEWLYAQEVTPAISSETTGTLNERALSIENWWKEYQPKIADRLVPFVRNVMANEPDVDLPLKEPLFNALDHLAEGGSFSEQQLALIALEEEKQRMAGRAGNNKDVRITCGTKVKNVDYLAQNVSFGSLHFFGR